MRWNRVFVVLFWFACVVLLLIVLERSLNLESFTPLEKGRIIAQKNNDLVVISERYLREVKDDNRMKFNVQDLFSTSAEEDLSHSSIDFGLNFHEWLEVCGDSVDSIVSYPLFPSLPSSRKVLYGLNGLTFKPTVGFRLFGILVTRVPGPYQFLVSYSGLDLQLWVSNGTQPEKSSLILPMNNTKHVNFERAFGIVQVLSSLTYFEVIGKTNTKQGHLDIRWQVPSQNYFTDIDKSSLRLYLRDSSSEENAVFLDSPVEASLPMHIQSAYREDFYSVANSQRRTMFKYPFVPQQDTLDILKDCPYEPSYIIKKGLKKYAGVWETHYTSVHPRDGTDIVYALKSGKFQTIFGNDLVDDGEASMVVARVMEALQRRNKGKYALKSIFNVERNEDPVKGNRYLVELELMKQDSGQSFRFSEYVFMPKGTHDLCFPSQFRWNKTADVNVILTVGNQGRWLKHFIDQMSRIYEVTKDENLNIIVIDFSSRDIDVVRALRESRLNRYVLVSRKGKFHKTAAIQEGIGLLRDRDAITLQVDLHLVFPDDFIDNVRKFCFDCPFSQHCVQGKMAYSPVLTRLQCGAIPQRPTGNWEEVGYGIFGIYKSDWDSFGGMNVAGFKNQWGGEDWDLVDRVLRAGYEVERLKVPFFSHVFHSKKGMWHKMKTK